MMDSAVGADTDDLLEAALHLRSLAGFLADVVLSLEERRLLAWADGPLVALDGWQSDHGAHLEALALRLERHAAGLGTTGRASLPDAP